MCIFCFLITTCFEVFDFSILMFAPYILLFYELHLVLLLFFYLFHLFLL